MPRFTHNFLSGSDAVSSALAENGVAWFATDRPVKIAVRGGCMGDALRDSSYVEVLAQHRYWPGDVVIGYWRNGGFRIHRVIGGYRRRGIRKIVTQADRANRPDAAIAIAYVMGKVVAGDIDRRLIRIPLRDRLWAFGRFLRFSLARLVRR